MKKFFTLAVFLFGITVAAHAQWPGGDPNDTVVVPPPPPPTITYFGRGGVVVWPDGTTQYCPEAGMAVCATSNGTYPNDSITMFGGGGVVVYPDGKTLYCPLPGDGICAIFVRQNPTGGMAGIYGSGGVVVWPDGTTHYCPNPGNTLCAITPTRGFVPNADIVHNGTTQGSSNTGVTVYDANGNALELHDARYAQPVAPRAKQATTGTSSGSKIE